MNLSAENMFAVGNALAAIAQYVETRDIAPNDHRGAEIIEEYRLVAQEAIGILSAYEFKALAEMVHPSRIEAVKRNG